MWYNSQETNCLTQSPRGMVCMSELNQSSEQQFRQEIFTLQGQIEYLEQIKDQYYKNLRQLEEKEAFNFALFQFNPIYTVVVDLNGKVVKSNAAKRKSGDRLPNIGDTMYKDYASHHETDMNAELMDAIRTNTIKKFPEMKYGGKYLSVSISPFPQGAIITSQDITEQKIAERDRQNLIEELQRALNEVVQLRSLLPICASCKRIRDDKGYWNHIESYLSKHSNLDFTHTICPECVQEKYPEYWNQIQKNKETNQNNQLPPS